eukprot:g5149.t1
MLGRLLVLSLVTPALVAGYDDRPMNEDEYFGARMQEHHQGAGLYQEPQGGGKMSLILGAIAGASIEWFWTGRTMKKNRKELEKAQETFIQEWNKERDQLMARRTYPVKLLANELEDAEVQLQQLIAAAEDAGIDMAGFQGVGPPRQPYQRTVAQDNLEYEEFRQPDVNGDNVITKTEFNQYIRKYLTMYPDTPQADIPRFEDFDINHDGVVTFDEWQMYLDRHREAEEYADSELMRGMYDSSASSQGFNSLAQNLQRQGRGRY